MGKCQIKDYLQNLYTSITTLSIQTFLEHLLNMPYAKMNLSSFNPQNFKNQQIFANTINSKLNHYTNFFILYY